MAITATKQPKSIFETILEWSSDRPGWQRDALRRIVQRGRLDNNDLQELILLCKQARGMAGTAKLSVLTKNHVPANPSAGASVALLSIKDVADANILAPGQTLSFGPAGLSIVYGDNATGKSGYARILKRACRARYSGQIEGNVYAQQAGRPAQATITYSVGGVPQPPERWQDSEHPHQTLSAVSVFDCDCAPIHLQGKNEVAFRPFGLDVPDELANVCQRIREALTAEKEQLESIRNPLFLKPPWNPQTTVGKALSALNHATDKIKLSALATLSEDERTRLDRLKEDLSKDPIKASAEQKLKADNIKAALEAMSSILAATADNALSHVFDLVRASKAKRQAARLTAEKAFSSEQLKDIGGQVWRALWDAARRYSTQVAYPGQTFPATRGETLCVLCQQPLKSEALARMQQFEKFISEDTERQAQDAEKLANEAIQKLTARNIATRPIMSALRQIEISDLVSENV